MIRDFGGLAVGHAVDVVTPRDVEGVRACIAFARDRGVGVTVRGGGYSQSGQSLPAGGIALDCTKLDRIGPLDDGDRIWCEGGARWRDVVSATASLGLQPVVLPLNLDMTVGGLLSAGGIGSGSHRFGPVVANVLALDVVTGAGELVRSSARDNRDLFHGVLSGLGRCGVIARACIALRRVRAHVRRRELAFRSISDWLDAARGLCDADHLEGFCRGDGSFALHLGVECDEGEMTASEFAARYQPRFDTMRATGAWQKLHPWFECLIPASAAPRLIPKALAILPAALGDGHRLMFVSRRDVPPLFAVPEGSGDVLCFAVLPVGVDPSSRDEALAALRAVDEMMRAEGGKRYLSGWLFDTDWRAHYGAAYCRFEEARRRFDAIGVFRSALFPN